MQKPFLRSVFRKLLGLREGVMRASRLNENQQLTKTGPKTDALFVDEDIKELIPQRSPILMVDTLYEATTDEATAGLTIKEGNLFLKDGKFTEPGLIEHIAQSASAFAGYSARLQGRPAPVGYIGEIKKFHLEKLPVTGSVLITHIKIMGVVGNVSLLTADVSVGGESVCTTNLKIAIEEK